MTIAEQYAHALLKASSTTSPSEALNHLREALKRRGHEKLLPTIVREYEKLEQARERSQNYKQVTPQMRRTRALIELYERLIQA